MKIGEVARRLGTTPRTLRFYEERGLLAPARSDGGTRRYDEADLERFRAILTLAAAGMALADIEVLARVWRQSGSGDRAGKNGQAMLARLAGELRLRREGLERLEADVERARSVLARCAGCAEAPTARHCRRCPITANRDGVQLLRLIWEKPGD